MKLHGCNAVIKRLTEASAYQRKRIFLVDARGKSKALNSVYRMMTLTQDQVVQKHAYFNYGDPSGWIQVGVTQFVILTDTL